MTQRKRREGGRETERETETETQNLDKNTGTQKSAKWNELKTQDCAKRVVLKKNTFMWETGSVEKVKKDLMSKDSLTIYH